MKTIIAVLLIFVSISCSTVNDEHAELQIMNTVCIDGILSYSVCDGYNCFYVPVSIEGEFLRCNK